MGVNCLKELALHSDYPDICFHDWKFIYPGNAEGPDPFH